MKKRKISNVIIRRLPRYYRALDLLYRNNTERVSSSELGNLMGVTASQIRQDLSCFGEFGQQGYGYRVDHLRLAVRRIMGMEKQKSTVLLGVGNLGRVLLMNFPFEENAFSLDAVFDTDPVVIGKKVGRWTVRGVEELEAFLMENSVDVGILTVPKASAQEMTDSLVKGGVRGIWNFTNTEVSAGETIVENIHFSDSLLTLGYLIST